jgi:hypothetical protein
VLVASAPALAACGSEDDLAQRAVDRVNAGSAPILLRELVQPPEMVSACRVHPRPGRPGELLLTVVTDSGTGLEATIDPDETLRIEDVTQRGFDRQAVAALRSGGKACTVSSVDGSLALVD